MKLRSRVVVAVVTVVVALVWAASSQAASTSILSVPGEVVPGTPHKYDKVMVRRYGSANAKRVLVLVPGTDAGAGYFGNVATYLSSHVPNLQVWAEMRREGVLENNKVLLKAIKGKVSLQYAFNYYLGWLSDPSISPHYQPLNAADYGFVKSWGLNVAMNDLHAVIEKARDGGKRQVVLGGHSLGGAEASIYPAWSFDGHPGYKDLSGIVEIDGGELGPRITGFPSITTTAQARTQLASLNTSGPFSALLDNIPWAAGAFGELAALEALKAPNAPSAIQAFPLLPTELKAPKPLTNLAALGYSFDAATSPSALDLIHVHSGHLATGDPAGWVNDGPTPIQNVAKAFSIEPLGSIDWYYPERLTIDVQAAHSLTETPAARTLGLHLKYLHQVDIPLFAIQTSLGGESNAVMDGAKEYKRVSKIPSVEIINKAKTYSHLDPLLAAPAKNAFLRNVAPWLEKVAFAAHSSHS